MFFLPRERKHQIENDFVRALDNQEVQRWDDYTTSYPRLIQFTDGMNQAFDAFHDLNNLIDSPERRLTRARLEEKLMQVLARILQDGLANKQVKFANEAEARELRRLADEFHKCMNDNQVSDKLIAALKVITETVLAGLLIAAVVAGFMLAPGAAVAAGAAITNSATCAFILAEIIAFIEGFCLGIVMYTPLIPIYSAVQQIQFLCDSEMDAIDRLVDSLVASEIGIELSEQEMAENAAALNQYPQLLRRA